MIGQGAPFAGPCIEALERLVSLENEPLHSGYTKVSQPCPPHPNFTNLAKDLAKRAD